MKLSNSEKQKKYREKKKLKSTNTTLRNNDILRGLKKSSVKDKVVAKENLKYNNEAWNTFYYTISEIVKHNFSTENSYMLTVTSTYKWSYEKYYGLVSRLLSNSYLSNLCYFGLPEKDKQLTTPHYHIMVKGDSQTIDRLRKVLHSEWINSELGGYCLQRVEKDRKFNDYLLKYVKVTSTNYREYNFDYMLTNIDLKQLDSLDVYDIGRWTEVKSSKRTTTIDCISNEQLAVDECLSNGKSSSNYIHVAHKRLDHLMDKAIVILNKGRKKVCNMLYKLKKLIY